MKRHELLKLTKVERMQRAIELFRQNDITILNASVSVISIMHGKSIVLYYPAKDWYSGKSVKDGRFIETLIAQIKTRKFKSATGKIKEEFWLIDKDLFRSLGKVDTPIYQTSNHYEAFVKSQKIVNSCIVLTKYFENFDGSFNITFQQIKRYRETNQWNR